MPDLSRKLILETPVRSPDGAGGFLTEWQELGTLWGEVLPRGGAGAGDITRVGLAITLRAAPQGAPARPKSGQRFRDGQRIYRIESVTEADSRLHWLICLASEERAT